MIQKEKGCLNNSDSLFYYKQIYLPLWTIHLFDKLSKCFATIVFKSYKVVVLILITDTPRGKKMQTVPISRPTGVVSNSALL